MQIPTEKYTQDIKLPENALPINKGDVFCAKIKIFHSLITKQKCKLWTVVKTAVKRLTCTATHYHYMPNVSRQKFHTNCSVEFEPDLYESYLLTFILNQLVNLPGAWPLLKALIMITNHSN